MIVDWAKARYSARGLFLTTGRQDLPISLTAVAMELTAGFMWS